MSYTGSPAHISGMTLFREALEAMRRRADAATKGPWHVEASGQDRDRLHIIDAVVRDPYGDNALSLGNDAATAEFIAHARTDVPRLLAAVQGVLNLPHEESCAGTVCSCSLAGPMHVITTALGENTSTQLPKDHHAERI